MTLRVRIENPEDGGHEAHVREMSLSTNGERHQQGETVVLKPGESHETYVHDGIMVEVTEGMPLPS